jgi:hypothetical protein
MWISIFQAIDELVSSKNPNLLFLFQVLRSWGWDLTIVGRQPKTPIFASIVYDINPLSAQYLNNGFWLKHFWNAIFFTRISRNSSHTLFL